VLDVEHHVSKDGQGVMDRERAVGKDGECGTLGGRWHDDKHWHKHLGLRFLASIGGWEQLPGPIACQKGHIDAEVCAFTAGEEPRGLLVKPCACRRRRAMASVMDGLKRDVAIGAKTKDHAERLPERGQAA
jgi:hypothetical protein